MLNRIARAVLFVLAVLVTLAALTCALVNWTGRRAWNEHRRVREAKGEWPTWAKVMPPPIPDERNLACHPLFAEIFANATNGIKCRIDILEPLSSAMAANDSGDWRSGRRSALADTVARPRIEAGDPAWRDAMALLDELAAAMAERPACRFPVDYEAGYLALLPHVQKQRNLVRGFQLRALTALADGRADDALADVERMLRLTECTAAEPTLISLLVRIAGQQMVLHTVWEGVADRRWSAEQLERLQARLADVNVFEQLRIALQGERVFARTTLEMLLGDRRKMREMLGGMGIGSAAALRIIPRGLFYRNMLAVDRYYADGLLPAIDPAARRVDDAAVAAADAAIEAAARSPRHFLLAMLLPAVQKVTAKVVDQAAGLDLAVAACAVERYRLENGRLPDTLDSLALKPAGDVTLSYRPSGADRWEIAAQVAGTGAAAPITWRSAAIAAKSTAPSSEEPTGK